jgi:hypothetical protein
VSLSHSELILKYESYEQLVRLLGRGISPWQGRYLNGTTEAQIKGRHVKSRITRTTHNPNV